jgi:hypothetical protein
MLTGTDETGVAVDLTPTQDIDLVYNKWSEIQHDCGMSPLHGGMYFSKALPAGEELCTGLAFVVVNRANMLKVGNSEGAFADLDDTSIIVKKSSDKENSSKKE